MSCPIVQTRRWTPKTQRGHKRSSQWVHPEALPLPVFLDDLQFLPWPFALPLPLGFPAQGGTVVATGSWDNAV